MLRDKSRPAILVVAERHWAGASFGGPMLREIVVTCHPVNDDFGCKHELILE